MMNEHVPYILWNPDLPFPPHDEMEDLRIVTHVQVERAAKGGYHYLHETALARHDERLFACWANHPTHETNSDGELLRGTYSTDGGFTWAEPEVWLMPPAEGAESWNHPVLLSHEGRLWGFFTRWNDGRPSTEVFLYETGSWRSQHVRIPEFIPFKPPVKMVDGSWIMSGECYWFDGAVAISHGDDLTAWEVVRIPNPYGIEVRYAEATLMMLPDRIVAICRPRSDRVALVSESRDLGRSWTPLRRSNFPCGTGKPYCGQLSTGQHYLITNNAEEQRRLLSIAVTRPGGELFERVWKIRHQHYPKRRLLGREDGTYAGTPTEWSYPAAVEHEGNLYVTYTQGKEDAALSIIPLSVLAV